jgi:hypothetical protein
MISLQIVPRHGVDAYRLLRDKVTHEARTWAWKNRKRTRLTHKSDPKRGHIDVARADGVVVAEIRPVRPDDDWFFVEKFIGRIVAWFSSDIAAINVQFHDATSPPSRTNRRK